MTTEQLHDATAAPISRRVAGARAAANREPVPAPRVHESITDYEGTTVEVDDNPWASWEPPPSPKPSVDPSAALVTEQPAPAPATWGARRAVLRVLSLGLAHPAPGAEELAYRQDLETIRTTRWSRSVRIAVANPKGGSGKTPTAVILGGIIAEQGRPTAIWDASDSRGDLTERAMDEPSRCVSWIEESPAEFDTPGTIGAIPAKQSSFADVFGSVTPREFDGESIDRVTWALNRSYQVQIADTGNVPHSAAFEKVLSLADMLVIPVTPTASSVHKALALIERLQGQADFCPITANAVVALTRYGGPETPGLYPLIPGIFAAQGIGSVVHIPYDPAIARGTVIDTHELSRASRLAWTRLAAATVANITTAKDIQP